MNSVILKSCVVRKYPVINKYNAYKSVGNTFRQLSRDINFIVKRIKNENKNSNYYGSR